MKTQRRFALLMILGLFLSCSMTSLTLAFDDEAHIALSRRAISPEVSNLDSFLKTVLSFEFGGGLITTVNGKTVAQNVEEGAVNEDRPILWRPRHHFHNPRLSWDQAGWRPPPFSAQLGDSSVKWSQNESQSVGGEHSWKDARDSYFAALTATTVSERESLYAETFRSLGHLIHLVQDAAVPSHTRNDTHLNYKGIGDPDRFHGWAEGATGTIATTSPLFNAALLNQSTPNAIAPVPISRLIDFTDGDVGTLALTPGLSIGIAEYSSANFFSDDTINSLNFQSPLPSQLEVREPEDDASTPPKKRRYIYFRAGFGTQDYPLALASAMHPYVIDPLATPTDGGLDDKVFQGYGARLFPRAVGYSAGLIDYFFRAKIDTDDEVFGYVLVPWESRPTSIEVQGVQIVGDTQPPGASGTLRLVLIHINSYRGIPSDPIFSPGEKPLVVVSDAVPFTIGSQPQTVTFPFSQLPFPTVAPPQGSNLNYGNSYTALIVYRGTLGQELNNAVAAGGYCRYAPTEETWERFYSFERTATQAYIGKC